MVADTPTAPGHSAADTLELAIEHQRAGRFRQAESLCLDVLRTEPDSGHALHLLGLIAHQQGRQDVAVALIRKAIRLKPNNASFHSNLGSALLRQGKQGEAVEMFRRSVELDPQSPWLGSNLLLALHYLADCDRAALLAEAHAWASRHASRTPRSTTLAHDRDPERPIRIGYVSSDFRRHPVGFFLEPVIAAHDSRNVEVFCYFNHAQPDDLTDRLKGHVAGWRDIVTRDDGAVADLVQADQIDILLDLAGHTGFNRLGLFALRPAPIQATWLGYSDTTGMPSIDYFVADRFVCPEGDEDSFVETPLRLPNAFLCYAPPEDAPVVSSLPACTKGFVTFGCFNNIAKLTPDVVRLWSDILHRLPTAQLFLKTRALGEPSVRARYRQLFADFGIVPERLRFEGASIHAEYMASFLEVDIGLDPFPFNGGTTTVDALWMGVPVLALRGTRSVSQLGASHLSAANCSEFIADSTDEYIHTAVSLATDTGRLAEVRASLRGRVASSPLCDIHTFTRDLENAYRTMWRRWCSDTTQ